MVCICVVVEFMTFYNGVKVVVDCPDHGQWEISDD